MAAFAPWKVSSKCGDTVLTTDAAVGVDKTFDPVGYTAPGIARYEDRSGGIQVGYPVLTLGVRRPSKASAISRVSLKLVVPTLEQLAPSTVWTKAYDNTGMMDFLLHQRSTLAERQALFRYMMSLFFATINASDGSPTDATGAALKAAIENFEIPY